MANSINSAMFLIESRLADAAEGDADALYELGIVYSSGLHGLEIDLIQAHKWCPPWPAWNAGMSAAPKWLMK